VQRACDAVGDTHQTIAGAGPDQAFAVLHQREGGAATQAHGAVDAREVAVAVPDQQAVVVGVGPDVAFVVLQQRIDAQRGNLRHRFEARAGRVAYIDAIVSADQQAAVAQAQRRQHHRRGQAVVFVEQRARRGVGNAGEQAVLAADHDGAVAIGGDAVDPGAGNHRAFRPLVEAAAIAIDVHQAAFGADPPAELAVGHHCRHPEVVERLRRQRGPVAIAIAPDALAAGTGNEVSLRVAGDGLEAARAQAGRVAGVEQREAVAVEAHQAVPGRHPDEAFGVLGDAMDLVVRQVVERGPLPDVVAPRRLDLRRVGEHRRTGNQQQAEGCAGNPDGGADTIHGSHYVKVPSGKGTTRSGVARYGRRAVAVARVPVIVWTRTVAAAPRACFSEGSRGDRRAAHALIRCGCQPHRAWR
jgi:hypothetical protein